MTKIYFDGFYYSRSIPWEDWHAGVRMHGQRFHFRRYFSNHIWLGAYRDRPFDFWADSEQLDSNAIAAIKRGHGPIGREADPLWLAGTYEIVDGEIIQSLAPDDGGGYVWVTKYTIMDDRIVGPLEVKNPMTLLFKPAPSTLGQYKGES